MNPRELLENFILNNTDLECLENLLEEFNSFTVLKIERDEFRHSNFLAWLLNPNETHGTGDYLLSIFLKLISAKAAVLKIKCPSAVEIDSWHFDDAGVEREKKNIDIFIRCPSKKLVCIIENKVDAPLDEDQLRKYKLFIEKKYPNHRKIFVCLTIEGTHPDVKGYIPLSYTDISILIERLLENKRDKLNPEIVTFITHYNKVLRRYLMKDSELQELCGKIFKQHKDALDLIFRYKDQITYKIYKYIIEKIENDPDLNVARIPKKPTYIDFRVKGVEVQGIDVLFELAATPKWFMQLNLFIGGDFGKYDKKVAQKFFNFIKTKSVFNPPKANLSKNWSTIYKLEILKDFSVQDFKTIIDEEYKQFKNIDLPQIRDTISSFTP